MDVLPAACVEDKMHETGDSSGFPRLSQALK